MFPRSPRSRAARLHKRPGERGHGRMSFAADTQCVHRLVTLFPYVGIERTLSRHFRRSSRWETRPANFSKMLKNCSNKSSAKTRSLLAVFILCGRPIPSATTLTFTPMRKATGKSRLSIFSGNKCKSRRIRQITVLADFVAPEGFVTA